MNNKLKKECYGCSMTGVRRAVIYNKEALVVFHSPQGCGQIIREKDGKTANHLLALADEKTVPIFTTNISDNDIVFGAITRLEECLEYVIKKIAPKYIVIGNSCVAGIIGDDIVGIAGIISKKFSLPIFTVPSFGFMNGGYEEGLVDIAKALLEYYAKPSLKKEKAITVIGFAEKNSYELLFIKDVLQEWSYDINCVFPGASTILQMSKIPNSQACIFCGTHSKVNNSYRRVAQIIGEKYNINTIEAPAPIGIKNSLAWIQVVGNQLHIAKPLIKATLQRKNQEFNEAYAQYKKYFEGKNCIIYVNKMPDMTIYIDWFFELLEMTGIVVTKILFNQEINDKKRECFTKNLSIFGYNIEVGQLSNRALEEVDYIFSIRMEGPGKERLISIPYVNPPFDVKGIKEYLSKIFKVEMKKRHRG